MKYHFLVLEYMSVSGRWKQHFMRTVLRGGGLACSCRRMQHLAMLIQAGCIVSASGRCLRASVLKYRWPLLTDLCSTSITAVAFPKQMSCQTSAMIFSYVSVPTPSLQWLVLALSSEATAKRYVWSSSVKYRCLTVQTPGNGSNCNCQYNLHP